MRSLRSLLGSKSGIAVVLQTMSANVLILIVNLATGIVAARYLGVEGRGELAAIITLPTFLSVIMTLGLPSALLFHVRRAPGDSAELAGAALVIGGVMGAFATALGVLVAPWVLDQYDLALIRFTQGMMLMTFLGVYSLILLAALQTRDSFTAYNRIRYLQPAITLALLFGAGVIGGLTPYSGASIYLLAGLPAIIWNLVWVLREYRPQLQRFRESARRLLSYGLRAYGGELLASASTQVDRIIVVGIFAPSALGFYVIALNLSRSLAIFPGAVVPVLFPRTSGRAPEDVLRITGQAASFTTLALGAAAIALIVAGPWLLRILYGAEFEDASLAFRLLVVEAALSGVAVVLSQGFMSLNRPELVAWQYGAGVALVVPLLYLLAPRYGAEGAATALLCGTCARLVCTHACYRFGLGMRTPGIVPKVDFARNLLSAKAGTTPE